MPAVSTRVDPPAAVDAIGGSPPDANSSAYAEIVTGWSNAAMVADVDIGRLELARKYRYWPLASNTGSVTSARPSVACTLLPDSTEKRNAAPMWFGIWRV